ncbi:MAG: thermonuclease family protein [Cyanobacteria bacterium SID2]|nr:thermonuclease family protein [Cyanobacteria bacterium SID2]MBP0006391.1 thermonuclease family protein [Cyanobacteria bacterium SBC]
MGTRLKDIQVTQVVDGDTIEVQIDERQEFVRLICVDTEESTLHPAPETAKPVTEAGLAAAKLAQDYFMQANGDLCQVDLEFDTDDSPSACLDLHRGNCSRLVCYVHRGDSHYNLHLIDRGWSPYFTKYGRSRLYDRAFVTAEFYAQAYQRGIWNPHANEHTASRNYGSLTAWWALRASAIEDFRKIGHASGALSVQLDYAEILKAIETEREIIVFCDLQGGIRKRAEGGIIVFTGSRLFPMKFWVPTASSPQGQMLVRSIVTRYAGRGRGYAYVCGRVTMHRGIPQMVLRELSQLSDIPQTLQS